jgi:predicted dehydrogenase
VIRLAVIGAGVMGRAHAARIARNPRCELAAVVDPLPQPGPWFADLHSMPRVDGAIVATPNALHVETALPLLAAGVPVLIEKPLAETVQDGSRLLGARAPVLVGYHRRHSPALQAARAYVSSGALGRIVVVSAMTVFHKPAEYFDVAWRTGPAGGPIRINLAHDVDSLRVLVGDIESVEAIASSAARGLPVEDSAAVALRFAGGALGTLLLSDCAVAPWSWEQTSGENPMYARDSSQDCVTISGTGGSLALPSLRWWRQGVGSWASPFETGRLEFTPADPLDRQLDHFCDVIEGVAEPLVGVEEGLRSLEALEGIWRAAMRCREN